MVIHFRLEKVMSQRHSPIKYDDTPQNVFRHYRHLEQIGLAAPQVTYIMNDLIRAGINVNPDAITIAEAKESILSHFKHNAKA